MAKYSMLPPARLGTGAILAIIAAAGSIIASCAGKGILGLILALVSVPLALVGFVRSVSPEIRGGPLSIVAFFLATAGIIIAILEIVMHVSRFVFGV